MNGGFPDTSYLYQGLVSLQSRHFFFFLFPSSIEAFTFSNVCFHLRHLGCFGS